MGPPLSQLLRSGLPFSSRGVWQRSHIATFSTMYLPRSISAGLRRLAVLSPVFFACFTCALVDCVAVPASNNKAVRDSLVSLFIGSSLCGGRGFPRNLLELESLVNEEQVREQGPEMDRGVQVVDHLGTEGRLGPDHFDGGDGVARVPIQHSQECPVGLNRLTLVLY